MPSFDVVSEIDFHELTNAVDQANRELAQRFDFKGTDSTIVWAGEDVDLESSTEERLKAVLDVFYSKLGRRGVDFKSMETSDAHPSGKRWKQTCTLRQGIAQEDAKKITKLIRDEGPKGVKTQITGDEVRVSSKSRDDLQAVQAMIKAADYDFAVQYVNYR